MSWPLWQTEVPHPPHCPLLWTQLLADVVVKCVRNFLSIVSWAWASLRMKMWWGKKTSTCLAYSSGLQDKVYSVQLEKQTFSSSQLLHSSSCIRWVILQTSPCLQTWIVSQIVSRGNVCSPLPCKHCFLNQSKVWRIGCTRKGLCVCVFVAGGLAWLPSVKKSGSP